MMRSWVAQPINQRSRDKLSLAQLPQLLSQLQPDAEPSRDESEKEDHLVFSELEIALQGLAARARRE